MIDPRNEQPAALRLTGIGLHRLEGCHRSLPVPLRYDPPLTQT